MNNTRLTFWTIAVLLFCPPTDEAEVRKLFSRIHMRSTVCIISSGCLHVNKTRGMKICSWQGKRMCMPLFELISSSRTIHLKMVLLPHFKPTSPAPCCFSDMPLSPVGKGATLPHYSLGDLGLIPRPKHNIPTFLERTQALSATTRLGGLRKVLTRSVAVQTVSAPKVTHTLISSTVAQCKEHCVCCCGVVPTPQQQTQCSLHELMHMGWKVKCRGRFPVFFIIIFLRDNIILNFGISNS